jgi:phospholipid/cholesterol/gamma-HCH transport system substrate-binding protein
MPRTRSLAWSELKIGAIAIAAAVIVVISIFMLTGSRGFFWQRYSLKTRFDNVAGLNPGSPVRVAGYAVGSVTEMDFVGQAVEVTIEVNKSIRSRITTQSTAALGSVSLLGESAVDITAATGGTPIPEWGYVPTGPAASSLTDVAATATKGIEEITGLARDVRAGKGTVGKLMTDESAYRELEGFLATARDITDQLNRGGGSLGRMLKDPRAARSLEASLDNLNLITKRLEAGEGSLGQLLKDDSLSKSLRSTAASLDAVTAKLNRSDGTAGKLINDKALYDRLDSVTTRLDQLVAQLNSGEGTVGSLMHDKQLYDNANGAASELRSLISDIRKDPRKYPNVRVSVF